MVDKAGKDWLSENDQAHSPWGLGIDATVSATKLINAIIQDQVRAPDMLIPLLTIHGGEVEIVQTIISPASPVVNKKIKNLVLPMGTLFITIIRGGEVLIPRGDTDLLEDDQVIVLVRKVHEPVLRQIVMARGTDRKHA